MAATVSQRSIRVKTGTRSCARRLTQPGVNVQEGEYLLAVNGRELRGTDEIFELFEGTADKSTVLKVGPTADGKGARNVTVVPIETEAALRNRAWIEGNLHKVDKLSGGTTGLCLSA